MDKAMKIAVILTAMDKMSGVVNSAVSKSQKKLQSLSDGLNKFSNFAIVAGGLGTAFFASTVKAAEESEIAQNRLNQVFTSMGQAADEATSQSEKYASTLQMQIGVEDELIMAVQAKIATFEKASNAAGRANDIYNRATAAAFDMQAAGFGEAKGNIVQLGRALQDPISGISALRRSGITFTEAEQKKIKVLVAANKTFEAQNMILKAVEKQVGGVASKTVTKSQKMRIAWGEIQEQIGKRLLPAFIKLSTYMLDVVIPAVSAFIDKHPGLVKWLAISAAALLIIGTVAKVAAFAIGGLSAVVGFLSKAFLFLSKTIVFIGRLLLGSPVIMIIAAIAFGVYMIIKHWSKIRAFFIRLWDGIKRIFIIAMKAILWVVAAPVMLVIKYWRQISNFFRDLWNGVKEGVSRVFNAIGDAIIAPIKWVKKAWQDFKDWFSNLWDDIKTVGLNVMKGPGGVIQAKMEEQLKAQLKSQNQFKNTPSAAPTMWSQINKLMINPTPSAAPAPVATRGNTTTTLNYAPVINTSGFGGSADIKQVLDEHGRDMLKKIEEQQRKRDRTKY